MQNIIGIAMIVLLLIVGIIIYSCSGDSDESGEKTVMQMQQSEVDNVNDELENR